MKTSTWRSPDPAVADFLTDFQRRGDDPAADPAGQFADQFLSADPRQASVVSRDALRGFLPARRRMFEQAGVGPSRAVTARQLDLDDRHLLLAVDWDAERADRPPLRLESTFLIRRSADGALRILAYLNHRDLTALLTGGD